jgi:hypothetical protein
MTQPVRIDPELLDSAKRAGAERGRSAAQQIAFWAQIGRQLDASTSLSVADHNRVARLAAAYDELDPLAQAAERARWEREITERVTNADWSAEFAAEGMRYVVVADDGGSAKRVELASSRKKPVNRKATTRRVRTRG